MGLLYTLLIFGYFFITMFDKIYNTRIAEVLERLLRGFVLDFLDL